MEIFLGDLARCCCWWCFVVVVIIVGVGMEGSYLLGGLMVQEYNVGHFVDDLCKSCLVLYEWLIAREKIGVTEFLR